MLVRAIENAVTGQICPAGRYLPTPGQGDSFYLSSWKSFASQKV